ncbi:hypothetical protein [Allosphingosinicella sp.]|uniref:hypothetical protein n=1 Tax=Allosphingosinicella sp. TaxID=2823234 RepID=UPI002EFF106E
MRSKPRRKIFGKKRKEVFLEHLAMTANVTASAEAAGVCVGTVYAHRMKDSEFRELWWIALEQGVAKLTALRLQLELERAQVGTVTSNCARLEVALDGPPDARQIRDFYALLQSMREHSRGLSGEAKAGRPGGTAEVGLVCREMAKRLKAFEVRDRGGDEGEGEGEGEGGGPSTTAFGGGPPPRDKLGEDQEQEPLHRPSDGPPPRDELGEE